MDPSKFDDLTKVLATSSSRRQTLKTIVATTLGGLLGLGGIGTPSLNVNPLATPVTMLTSAAVRCQDAVVGPAPT